MNVGRRRWTVDSTPGESPVVTRPPYVDAVLGVVRTVPVGAHLRRVALYGRVRRGARKALDGLVRRFRFARAVFEISPDSADGRDLALETKARAGETAARNFRASVIEGLKWNAVVAVSTQVTRLATESRARASALAVRLRTCLDCTALLKPGARSRGPGPRRRARAASLDHGERPLDRVLDERGSRPRTHCSRYRARVTARSALL